MRIAIAAAALVMAASPAFAKCDYYGNCYNVSPSYGGGYNVNGFSSQTGQTWNHRVDERGQRGYDAGGNYYDYNRNTGMYFNYGTGKMCTGKGAGRICN